MQQQQLQQQLHLCQFHFDFIFKTTVQDGFGTSSDGFRLNSGWIGNCFETDSERFRDGFALIRHAVSF